MDLNREFFTEIVTEIRTYCSRIDSIAEALGCGNCDSMYALPGLILDYFEWQSKKQWTDEIFDLIYNDQCTSPEVIWEKIQRLEENKNVE